MQGQEIGFLLKAGEKFQLTVTQMCSERGEAPVQRAEMGAVPESSSAELSFDRNRLVQTWLQLSQGKSFPSSQDRISI